GLFADGNQILLALAARAVGVAIVESAIDTGRGGEHLVAQLNLGEGLVLFGRGSEHERRPRFVRHVDPVAYQQWRRTVLASEPLAPHLLAVARPPAVGDS